MGFFRKAKKYAETAANEKFNELADPKIQLEQALVEAQEQHKKLTDQAAQVIANQKMAEMRLHRAMDELEKAQKNATTALQLGDTATDPAKKAQYEQAAQTYANQMITLESTVEEDKAMVEHTTVAAQQAQQAVSDNASVLQKKLAERHELLSKLDQAKMQEQMNTTLTAISSTMNQDVPTLDAVRDKIEARYAKALGTSELGDASDQHAMLEVEHAQTDAAAQARLSELRSKLGLPAPSAPAPSTNGNSAETVAANG
jgi:phage shock protein A